VTTLSLGRAGHPSPQKTPDLLPPCPYSFAASEAFRLHTFKLNRGTGPPLGDGKWLCACDSRQTPARPSASLAALPDRRTLAIRRFPPSLVPVELAGLFHAQYARRLLPPLRRFQTLWPRTPPVLSRFSSHRVPDLRPTAGKSTSIITPSFSPKNPDALTQLGWALKFYDISFLYAPTPQAKGKIEREHQFWQGRLPAYFASKNKFPRSKPPTHTSTPCDFTANAHETHRELRMTPQQAWKLAQQEKRSVLRPAPRCPWWPYVWSVRTALKVGSDGRVPSGPSAYASIVLRRQDRSLPPSHRPSFRPGRTTQQKMRNRHSFLPIAQNEPVLLC